MIGEGSSVWRKGTSWQSASGDLPLFQELFPESKAWYSWIAEDEVHIRILRRIDMKTHQAEFLTASGEWLWIPEMQLAPVGKILTAKEAERIEVPALKPEVHVRDHEYDRCLRCKITGEVFHKAVQEGRDPPCHGWVKFLDPFE